MDVINKQESVVALAAALVNVRELDADSKAPFTAVHDALKDVERLIFQHKENFGADSVHFQQGCEEFLLLSNTLPMQAMQRLLPEDSVAMEQCGELLLRAEQHTRRRGHLRNIPEQHHLSRRQVFRLITLNNLACHAKYAGKPEMAVKYLEKVLKLQLKPFESETSPTAAPPAEVAITRLNLCAVLSQLHRHAAAAIQAKDAIAKLTQNGDNNFSPEVAQLLLVAHYNFAVELEHLGDNDTAWRNYELVVNAAERYQVQHDLVGSVREILSRGSVRNRSIERAPLSPRARTPRRLGTK